MASTRSRSGKPVGSGTIRCTAGASLRLRQAGSLTEANGHTVDVSEFHTTLLAWGKDHFRAFPWRLSHDPYAILIAEVFLHRTQVAQVLPVYEEYIHRFPDLHSAVKAPRDETHSLLCSLGLRWRVDLLLAMFHELADRFDGEIPTGKDELVTLPGVSDYIAGAVRCFAWNMPDALMDTNTVRVVGRLFGLEVKDSSRRNRTFRELAEALVCRSEPRRYHYALLDLADSLCTPGDQPGCARCPIAAQCRHGAAGRLESDGPHRSASAPAQTSMVGGSSS
jgi:A/G-specific adenine glycosylase